MTPAEILRADQQQDWQWWAGRCDDHFEIGPLNTKQEAIEEALRQGAFEEVEVNGEWRRLVYFAECRGLHYECDECGIVKEACDECRVHLYPEESAGTFAGTRNEGSAFFEYDDDRAIELAEADQ